MTTSCKSDIRTSVTLTPMLTQLSPLVVEIKSFCALVPIQTLTATATTAQLFGIQLLRRIIAANPTPIWLEQSHTMLKL
jgi:hypothetical protein